MMAWAHANGPNDEFVQPSPHYAASQPTAAAGKLAYGGGVNGVGVMSGPNEVYIVFYGSQWGTAGTDANGYTTFSNDRTAPPWPPRSSSRASARTTRTYQADLTQWCEGIANGSSTCPTSGGSWVSYQTNILKGVWYDNAAASPAQATGTQLAQEAVKTVQHSA
jgi:serine protease